MSERLIVVAIPQNLDGEYAIMGVPIREIGIFGLGPIGLAAVVRLFELDVTLPFPLFGGILLSNVILWILGPLGFIGLRQWKRRNPDVALTDALTAYFGPRSWAAGPRDVDFVPYIADPRPRAPARQSHQTHELDGGRAASRTVR